MKILNVFLALFSAVWLVGHSTVRLFDWEFWFAALFLAASVASLLFLTRFSVSR